MTLDIFNMSLSKLLLLTLAVALTFSMRIQHEEETWSYYAPSTMNSLEKSYDKIIR